MKYKYAKIATLHLDGWAGRTKTSVLVIGETPKRYRITTGTPIRLAGRDRWLQPNRVALVPKHAVTF